MAGEEGGREQSFTGKVKTVTLVHVLILTPSKGRAQEVCLEQSSVSENLSFRILSWRHELPKS